MRFCDAEGKYSGYVTIADSVVMRSNIQSPDPDTAEVAIQNPRFEVRDGRNNTILQTEIKNVISAPLKIAGVFPKCGSNLVWRVAQKPGEKYRGCTNYDSGCRYQERSYRICVVSFFIDHRLRLG